MPQQMPYPAIAFYASGAPRVGVQPQSTLDISQLDATVEGFLGDYIAPTTRVAYKLAQCCYAAICVKYGIATPYTVEDDTLCRYVAFLAMEGLRHRSIEVYLSGIRCLLIQRGMGNPFASSLPRLKYVLTSIKQVEARGGSGSRTRLPITMEILKHLQGVGLAQPQWTDGIMLWAVVCVGSLASSGQASSQSHLQRRMTQTPI